MIKSSCSVCGDKRFKVYTFRIEDDYLVFDGKCNNCGSGKTVGIGAFNRCMYTEDENPGPKVVVISETITGDDLDNYIRGEFSGEISINDGETNHRVNVTCPNCKGMDLYELYLKADTWHLKCVDCGHKWTVKDKIIIKKDGLK